MKHITLCLLMLVFLCGCGKNAEKESLSPTLAPVDTTVSSDDVEEPSPAETVIAETPEPEETDVALPELTLTEAEPAATDAPASQPTATNAPSATEAPADPETEVPWDVTEDGIELPMDPL